MKKLVATLCISKQEIIDMVVDFCESHRLVDANTVQTATIQSTVKDIFGLLDAKTSWGRNELKAAITDLINEKSQPLSQELF